MTTRPAPHTLTVLQLLVLTRLDKIRPQSATQVADWLAWRCAIEPENGFQFHTLARLAKAGYVWKCPGVPARYRLSTKGEEALEALAFVGLRSGGRKKFAARQKTSEAS